MKQSAQPELARSGQGQSQPKPLAVSAVPDGMVPAYFTERELFQLKNACRDSDNENAIRFLNAALARAEGGK